MLERTFGSTSIQVPVIGQGTWMIEGSTRETERRAVQTLKLGLDLGMTHIDTAEMYDNGHAEELVGEAIAGRRDEVFLVSKVLPSNASYEGTLKACVQSLKRLNTDWLDLYLLHWPGNHPIGETMKAMEKLVDDGLVRFIGVSNFDVEELGAAEQTLSKYRIACNQVLYHLGSRGIERRLLPYCKDRGIAVVGYSPFGHGNFPSIHSTGGLVLSDIAKRHGQTVRQVVLNFLTRDSNLFTIPMSSRPEHVSENSGCVGWDLTKDDLVTIDKAFPVKDYDLPLDII